MVALLGNGASSLGKQSCYIPIRIGTPGLEASLQNVLKLIRKWVLFNSLASLDASHKDGKIYTGEPQSPLTWPKAGASLKATAGDQDSLTAKLVSGDVFSRSSSVTNTVVPVARILSPLAHVPVFRCIGLNYAKHAEETNMPIPKYPILFMKPSSALQDPFKSVVIPTIAENNQADFECELAVIIGKPCKNVVESEALDHVLGYTVGNDISARKWQGNNLGSGQWCFSKSFDTFAPLGPCLVSPALIKDPNQLRIKTTLNGKLMQDSSTSDMIFSVPRLISFLSQSTTLMPGDVIMTGTPEGVGFKREPPVFLQHGDHVVCEIENIGELHNTIAYESKLHPEE
ncbi:hypothetical protein BGX28_000544 [Mortierella sp. GBA30]|nr:hypothetical protein BGX28_000544 [Mortierella sp. GBA30]